MRILSYCIALTIAGVIGVSSLNSFDMIRNQPVEVGEQVETEDEEFYVLKPIMDFLLSDLNS